MRTDFAGTRPLAFGLLLSSVALCGCGGDGLATYPARGTVTFPDGKPLAGGSIIFQSTEHPVTARSPILDDGTFELGTYQPGDGAVEGEHRVAILPPKPQRDTDEGAVLPDIDAKYQNPERSGLVYEVQPDGDNQFEITVTPPPVR